MEMLKSSPYCKGSLSDYVDINPKTDCKGLSNSSVVSFVPMPNVREKTNIVTYDLVPYELVKKGFTVFQKHDLIWAKITPCMQNGKSCIVDDMPTEIGFGSTEFHVIRNRDKRVYMPFLWAVLSNDNVLKAAQAVFNGSAGQQRVSSSFLERFPAVIPEKNIQEKLVLQLEEKLCVLHKKKNKANELLSNQSSILLQHLNINIGKHISPLCSAVSLMCIIKDKTLNADYYHSERLNAINSMKNNSLFRLSRLIDVVDFCRSIVNSSDVNERYLGLSGVESQTGELTDFEEDASGQAFTYQSNDVLYGRLRPYLNKVYFAEQSGICSTEFHVMRVKNKNDLLPEYLAEVMRSDLILSQTKHMMTGNTHPRISNDDVKNLYIPIPDILLQQQIIKEIRNRRTEARNLKIEAEKEWQEAKKQFEKELLEG